MERRNSPLAFDYRALAFVTAAVSLASFVFYLLRDEVLLYGDAVAHINIARRVFDSRTPGPLQLGTVWLPLPHILTIPFIVSGWAWRTGVGGSVASLVAYVVGALGVARFFWGGALGVAQISRDARRAPGWIAAAAFLLNPNLIYMQATAMTEAMSLALTVWAIVFYAEFVAAQERSQVTTLAASELEAAARQAQQSLTRCAIMLAAGMLTRYDQWFLAAAILVCVVFAQMRSPAESVEQTAILRNEWRAFKKSALLLALVAALWLGYNYGQFGNALEFATGSYSARAIAQRSAVAGQPPHPGYHNLRTAAVYFLKSAELNLAQGRLAYLWIATALAAILWLLLRKRLDLILLLWLPLVFYSLSIAYGGVPIFMPVWWPFSYYNVRYGLELLPAFAVSAGLIFAALSRIRLAPWKVGLQATFLLALLASYVQVQVAAPICLREAVVNSVARRNFERQLAAIVSTLPEGATLLMYTGNHVGALQTAGIPLRHTVNENNYRMWQAALAHPARDADYVVAMEGDPVWSATHEYPENLKPLMVVSVPGQPEAVVYQSSLSVKAH